MMSRRSWSGGHGQAQSGEPTTSGRTFGRRPRRIPARSPRRERGSVPVSSERLLSFDTTGAGVPVGRSQFGDNADEGAAMSAYGLPAQLAGSVVVGRCHVFTLHLLAQVRQGVERGSGRGATVAASSPYALARSRIRLPSPLRAHSGVALDFRSFVLAPSLSGLPYPRQPFVQGSPLRVVVVSRQRLSRQEACEAPQWC